MAAAVLALAGPVTAAVATASGAHPIEDRYGAPGPHAVTTSTGADAQGRAVELTHPADLTPGDRFPIVTWGNGSGATPGQYEGLLRHLASWGYVVVAATTTESGTGIEILAAARAVVAMATDPASALFDAVDPSSVAAVGHSQGAGGSVRAAHLADGFITTVVTVALPNRIFVIPPGQGKDFDPAWLDVPVLFLSGEHDQLISGTGTNQAHFDDAPGPAARADLLGADHNTIQRSGGRFLGYLTAWLEYQRGEADAARAFVGDAPELDGNPAWRAFQTKGLELPAAPSAVVSVPTTSMSTSTSMSTAPPRPATPRSEAAASPAPPELPATGRPVGTTVAIALLVAGLAGRRLATGSP